MSHSLATTLVETHTALTLLRRMIEKRGLISYMRDIDTLIAITIDETQKATDLLELPHRQH